jgi:predicted 3-demethylubiquinone-9 3-methyltransferase (glyoxalase superfamily)
MAERKTNAAGSRTPFGVSWQVVPKQLEELLEQDATGESHPSDAQDEEDHH